MHQQFLRAQMRSTSSSAALAAATAGCRMSNTSAGCSGMQLLPPPRPLPVVSSHKHAGAHHSPSRSASADL
jgi:hypothetical protein